MLSPVRSLARSGWFMRQWLANFTHSSLTGTWMSLNLGENIRNFMKTEPKHFFYHSHQKKCLELGCILCMGPTLNTQVTHRPKKHCHSGRFCDASSESLAPNNFASNRTTARRSSPSLLYGAGAEGKKERMGRQ